MRSSGFVMDMCGWTYVHVFLFPSVSHMRRAYSHIQQVSFHQVYSKRVNSYVQKWPGTSNIHRTQPGSPSRGTEGGPLGADEDAGDAQEADSQRMWTQLRSVKTLKKTTVFSGILVGFMNQYPFRIQDQGETSQQSIRSQSSKSTSASIY